MEYSTPTTIPTSSVPTQPAETPVAVGLRYGLYTALVWIIVDVILRITGLSFRFFTVYLPVSLTISITAIVIAHRYYKSRNRNLSWREGFLIGVVLMLVCGIINHLFNWAYVNFIDPEYPARFRADMQAWMESFPNMPQEKLDEAMSDMSDENLKSFGLSFKKALGWLTGSSAVISAIVSLFTKRQPAEFE